MLLDEALMTILDGLQPKTAVALAGDSDYVNSCGCTGNCGQSCSGGCETGCTGNCGRSCSGSCS